MADVGHIIRSIREARGLGLSEVAKAANIGTSFLSLIELNERKAQSDTLRLIAKALRVPENLLLTSAGFLPIGKDRLNRVKELASTLDQLYSAEMALRKRLGIRDGSS